MSAEQVNITTREVATLARVAPSTVRRWAESGALPPSQITPGGQYRFNRSDVLALLSPSTPTARPVDDPPVSAGRATSVVEGRA